MERDRLDDDRLDYWRKHVETGNPEAVAIWACSDISEETYFASWGEGCSDTILDAARGGRTGGYDISPADKVLLLRLWERLGKRWPQYIGPDDAPFTFPLRRWLIETIHEGQPMTTVPPCWEHGVIEQGPVELSPGVSLVPVGLHRLSDRHPADTTYTACRHRAVVVTRTALGYGRISVYIPPEGCDRVYFASPSPPETQLIHAEVERIMSEVGRTSKAFRG